MGVITNPPFLTSLRSLFFFLHQLRSTTNSLSAGGNLHSHFREMGASEEPVVDRVADPEKGLEEGVITDKDGNLLYQQQQPNRIGRNGEMGFTQTQPPTQFPPATRNLHQENPEFHLSRLDRLNPSNPLRVVINGGRSSRAAPFSRPPPTLSRPPFPPPPAAAPISQPPFPPPPPAAPISQPPYPPSAIPIIPQQSVVTLNSRGYTNKISLLLFILQTVAAIGLVGFLIYKGVDGILKGGKTKRKILKVIRNFLPQAEAASLLSITLAFSWQMAVRVWPKFMVHFILWSSFASTLSSGILLICFQKPSTSGVGVALLLFSVGNGLYACWVSQRIKFCTKVLLKSLEPVAKFHDINRPTYWMLGIGFLWMSLWVLAVIGALNFYAPPAIIIALVLSLAWTTEVMRNVVNLTVSRVIALYYLRGMQSNTKFCFQRAITRNLGSASLGSLFVPSIEALRIVARGLNLLEGEDEFMFSCAHCCLKVMQSVFKFGNSWAFVQIAAYGKSFTKASIDTWEVFQRHSQEMEVMVDSDITSALCFLSGVCSGALCTIMVAAWTSKTHQGFIATVSLLAFFVGYLMTRIAMALPHACISCYYVCYAENPNNRLFDNTIPDRLNMLRVGRDVSVPTPRIPRRFVNT